jgi:hypothetical protein
MYDSYEVDGHSNRDRLEYVAVSFALVLQIACGVLELFLGVPWIFVGIALLAWGAYNAYRMIDLFEFCWYGRI